MKGRQTLIILELLANRAAGSYDLLQKLFEDEYKKTYQREVKEYGRDAAVKKMRARYHNFLYKLRSNGLIVSRKEGDEIMFVISKKGTAKLSALRERSFFPNKRDYLIDDGAGITIVTFDIPERDRKKRDWLRSVLRYLGFAMIHRSVWVGKTRLPISLLKDLQAMKLFDHVETFQVSKAGNLRRLASHGV